MQNWTIKDARVFFALAGALVVYIVYMIVRRRKGLRAGHGHQEAEL
jgi:hypothetical protein